MMVMKHLWRSPFFLPAVLSLLVAVSCTSKSEPLIPVTPAWALGHIVWEDEFNTRDSLLGLVRQYREHDIPVDCGVSGDALLRNVSFREESHLLGNDLFTKAVTCEGAVRFTLPGEGRWVDWRTRERHEPGTVLSRTYALDEFPLFVREGSIIPVAEGEGIALLITPGPTAVQARFHLPLGEGTSFTDCQVRFDPVKGSIRIQSDTPGPWRIVLQDVTSVGRISGCTGAQYDPHTRQLSIGVRGRHASVKCKSLKMSSFGDVSDPGPVLSMERLPGNDGPKAAWGDTGDGYYRNPVLLADYSDPDAIRVGDRYYMVASDFHFMGMQVLESADLVNWKIISQIYSRLDLPGWNENGHYAGGSWAPSIRYHDGLFHVYFCTPDEGLFMSTASDPAGPWAPLHCVKPVYHWEDPCPFWDDDGQAYLGHSLWGAGPIIIHKMTPDGRELLDDGVTVYRGPVAEGTKIHKWNGYYYLSIPEGGVGGGWQTILRSKNIYGPYERKVVLETGSTKVNGPHQGAIVDTPGGEWWFLHFQELDPLGRVVHLQPMRWEDGWPVVGEDFDGNGIGEPVPCWKKPAAHTGVRELPASSDDFRGEKPGLQWQFNHNPEDDGWSLNRRKGFLALDGLEADSFRNARNTLTQKLMGYQGSYTVRLDMRDLADGQRAGLACMGGDNYCFGIRQTSGSRNLYFEKEGTVLDSLALAASEIWLRLSFDVNAGEGGFSFLYSLDGKRFERFGEAFTAHNGYWKGARPALYSYNTLKRGGTARFRDFVYAEENTHL